MLLGLLGSACGPMAAPEGETGGDSTGTTTTTGPTTPNPTDPTTSDPTVTTSPSGPTSDPTTDPTSEPTTGPIPECQSDADCGGSYCGYCSEGVCIESPGCCGEGSATPAHAKGWRCQPPFDCYSDSDCDYGYVCALNVCTSIAIIPLEPCQAQELALSEWDLSHSPSAFVLADLDGDMDLDLAAAQPGVAQIELALNDGAGNFVLAGAFPVGPPDGLLALATGDLDLDGDLDIAVTRRDDGGLVLLFGQDAVFKPAPPLVSANAPEQVFIADMNSDGAPDIVTVGGGTPQVSTRLGDGKGGFDNEILTTLGEAVVPVASLVELTGDGHPDLIAPRPGNQTFRVWGGSADGAFFSVRDFNDLAAPRALYGADLHSAPSFPEILNLRDTIDGGAVTVWSGVGPGLWHDLPTLFTGPLGLHGGVLARFDGSPDLDLVAATRSENVAVWVGDGQGGFSCQQVLPLPDKSTPELLAVGDVDGDGRLDIVAGHSDGGVSMLRPK